MLQPRATAQQAIEVLKVHQLRKENVIIFEEIKHLRGEVTSRKNELNDALKQVADLKAQLKKAINSAGDRDKMVEALKTSNESTRTSVEGLRQGLEAVKEDLTRKLGIQQTTAQKTDAVTKALREDIVQLRKHIESTDNKTVDLIESLNQDLDGKAEQQAVSELEDRLDQLVQSLEPTLETHRSVSRVTDTAEELVRQSSDRDLPNTHRYEESMWKPIRSALEAQTPAQQDPSTMARQITEERAEDHPPALTPLHAEANSRRNTISNIHHEIANQDKQPALVARPVTAQQQNVPVQPSKQRDIRIVSTEHRSGPVLFPSPQAQISRPHTNPEAMREALYAILKIGQGGNASLAHYLARFEDFLALVRADEQVAGICLTWFLEGLADDNERCPIEQWLRTSECPLQAVRDCIIILTRCLFSSAHEPQGRLNPIDRSIVDPSATAEKKTISEMPVSGKNMGGAKLDQDGLSHEERSEEAHNPLVGYSHPEESRPSSPTRGKSGLDAAAYATAAVQGSNQTPMERRFRGKSCGRDADPKTATKTGTGQGAKRQSQVEATKQERMAKVVTSVREKPPIQRAATPEIPVATGKIPRMLAELSTFNRSPPPQKVVEDSTKQNWPLVKRRGMVDPPEDSDGECMPSTPPNKTRPLPRTPAPRALESGDGISRVPTLVRLTRARSAILETSDPIRLPPVRSHKSHGKQSMEMYQLRKRRKLRDDTPPDIPILTLTPSDFHE
ncbi:hypothetical protein LTR70_005168 [Exophiala xenobiotica]|uniref:Uncharacterized protein n=1 Tax=Lithohypha guttulata TaxID=1690604 RepID=A0ABR0KBI9_9EURO|nr:hypothetical protein LTR24_004764 [Lithohypha guttulata]KAK5318872.1 hypothetical protein LTR70_005168 [Exophiala xenobiotica]